MPFVVTLLPFVGLSFLAHENTEWALLAIAAAFGVTSLCLGFRTHRSQRALAVLSLGVAFLFCGRVLEENGVGWGAFAMIAGGCTVAASHFINRALCRACRSCHDSHHHDAENKGSESA